MKGKSQNTVNTNSQKPTSTSFKTKNTTNLEAKTKSLNFNAIDNSKKLEKSSTLNSNSNKHKSINFNSQISNTNKTTAKNNTNTNNINMLNKKSSISINKPVKLINNNNTNTAITNNTNNTNTNAKMNLNRKSSNLLITTKTNTNNNNNSNTKNDNMHSSTSIIKENSNIINNTINNSSRNYKNNTSNSNCNDSNNKIRNNSNKSTNCKKKKNTKDSFLDSIHKTDSNNLIKIIKRKENTNKLEATLQTTNCEETQNTLSANNLNMNNTNITVATNSSNNINLVDSHFKSTKSSNNNNRVSMLESKESKIRNNNTIEANKNTYYNTNSNPDYNSQSKTPLQNKVKILNFESICFNNESNNQYIDIQSNNITERTIKYGNNNNNNNNNNNKSEELSSNSKNSYAAFKKNLSTKIKSIINIPDYKSAFKSNALSKRSKKSTKRVQIHEGDEKTIIDDVSVKHDNEFIDSTVNSILKFKEKTKLKKQATISCPIGYKQNTNEEDDEYSDLKSGVSNTSHKSLINFIIRHKYSSNSKRINRLNTMNFDDNSNKISKFWNRSNTLCDENANKNSFKLSDSKDNSSVIANNTDNHKNSDNNDIENLNNDINDINHNDKENINTISQQVSKIIKNRSNTNSVLKNNIYLHNNENNSITNDDNKRDKQSSISSNHDLLLNRLHSVFSNKSLLILNSNNNFHIFSNRTSNKSTVEVKINSNNGIGNTNTEIKRNLNKQLTISEFHRVSQIFKNLNLRNSNNKTQSSKNSFKFIKKSLNLDCNPSVFRNLSNSKITNSIISKTKNNSDITNNIYAKDSVSYVNLNNYVEENSYSSSDSEDQIEKQNISEISILEENSNKNEDKDTYSHYSYSSSAIVKNRDIDTFRNIFINRKPQNLNSLNDIEKNSITSVSNSYNNKIITNIIDIIFNLHINTNNNIVESNIFKEKLNNINNNNDDAKDTIKVSSPFGFIDNVKDFNNIDFYFLEFKNYVSHYIINTTNTQMKRDIRLLHKEHHIERLEKINESFNYLNNSLLNCFDSLNNYYHIKKNNDMNKKIKADKDLKYLSSLIPIQTITVFYHGINPNSNLVIENSEECFINNCIKIKRNKQERKNIKEYSNGLLKHTTVIGIEIERTKSNEKIGDSTIIDKDLNERISVSIENVEEEFEDMTNLFYKNEKDNIQILKQPITVKSKNKSIIDYKDNNKDSIFNSSNKPSIKEKPKLSFIIQDKEKDADSCLKEIRKHESLNNSNIINIDSANNNDKKINEDNTNNKIYSRVLSPTKQISCNSLIIEDINTIEDENPLELEVDNNNSNIDNNKSCISKSTFNKTKNYLLSVEDEETPENDDNYNKKDNQSNEKVLKENDENSENNQIEKSISGNYNDLLLTEEDNLRISERESENEEDKDSLFTPNRNKSKINALILSNQENETTSNKELVNNENNKSSNLNISVITNSDNITILENPDEEVMNNIKNNTYRTSEASNTNINNKDIRINNTSETSSVIITNKNCDVNIDDNASPQKLCLNSKKDSEYNNFNLTELTFNPKIQKKISNLSKKSLFSSKPSNKSSLKSNIINSNKLIAQLTNNSIKTNKTNKSKKSDKSKKSKPSASTIKSPNKILTIKKQSDNIINNYILTESSNNNNIINNTDNCNTQLDLNRRLSKISQSYQIETQQNHNYRGSDSSCKIINNYEIKNNITIANYLTEVKNDHQNNNQLNLYKPLSIEEEQYIEKQVLLILENYHLSEIDKKLKLKDLLLKLKSTYNSYYYQNYIKSLVISKFNIHSNRNDYKLRKNSVKAIGFTNDNNTNTINAIKDDSYNNHSDSEDNNYEENAITRSPPILKTKLNIDVDKINQQYKKLEKTEKLEISLSETSKKADNNLAYKSLVLKKNAVLCKSTLAADYGIKTSDSNIHLFYNYDETDEGLVDMKRNKQKFKKYLFTNNNNDIKLLNNRFKRNKLTNITNITSLTSLTNNTNNEISFSSENNIIYNKHYNSRVKNLNNIDNLNNKDNNICDINNNLIPIDNDKFSTIDYYDNKFENYDNKPNLNYTINSSNSKNILNDCYNPFNQMKKKDSSPEEKALLLCHISEENGIPIGDLNKYIKDLRKKEETNSVLDYIVDKINLSSGVGKETIQSTKNNSVINSNFNRYNHSKNKPSTAKQPKNKILNLLNEYNSINNANPLNNSINSNSNSIYINKDTDIKSLLNTLKSNNASTVKNSFRTCNSSKITMQKQGNQMNLKNLDSTITKKTNIISTIPKYTSNTTTNASNKRITGKKIIKSFKLSENFNRIEEKENSNNNSNDEEIDLSNNINLVDIKTKDLMNKINDEVPRKKSSFSIINNKNNNTSYFDSPSLLKSIEYNQDYYNNNNIHNNNFINNNNFSSINTVSTQGKKYFHKKVLSYAAINTHKIRDFIKHEFSEIEEKVNHLTSHRKNTLSVSSRDNRIKFNENNYNNSGNLKLIDLDDINKGVIKKKGCAHSLDFQLYSNKEKTRKINIIDFEYEDSDLDLYKVNRES